MTTTQKISRVKQGVLETQKVKQSFLKGETEARSGKWSRAKLNKMVVVSSQQDKALTRLNCHKYLIDPAKALKRARLRRTMEDRVLAKSEVKAWITHQVWSHYMNNNRLRSETLWYKNQDVAKIHGKAGQMMNIQMKSQGLFRPLRGLSV